MSFVDLGFARVDTDRARRCGFPEVIFGANKTPEEVAAIGRVILEKEGVLLVSRANEEQHMALSGAFPTARWHARARCLTVEITPVPKLEGTIGVVCAGTSDLPVAEEASVTLDRMARTNSSFSLGRNWFEWTRSRSHRTKA